MDGKGKTILVAEDHGSNLKLLALLLEQAQYDIHLAADGVEAVDDIARNPTPADPVIAMLNQGILRPAVNIKNLNKRVAELREMPHAAGPMLRALHAMDLPGWNLNQQQHLLQRNHLRVAISQLLREHFSRETAPA